MRQILKQFHAVHAAEIQVS